jgi:virginiamycin A acetyltransferase
MGSRGGTGRSKVCLYGLRKEGRPADRDGRGFPGVSRLPRRLAAAGAGEGIPGLVGDVRADPPGLCGVYLRLAFYRLVLARCAPDVCIGFGTVLAHPGIRLGRGVYTGVYCSLGNVELGDDVLLASHVSITNGGRQHGIERLDVPIRMQPGVWIPVRIGEDSWIGEQAVVMADVGSHCVIGAGAVVTRPVPDFAIAVGVAAKVIG